MLTVSERRVGVGCVDRQVRPLPPMGEVPPAQRRSKFPGCLVGVAILVAARSERGILTPEVSRGVAWLDSAPYSQEHLASTSSALVFILRARQRQCRASLHRWLRCHRMGEAGLFLFGPDLRWAAPFMNTPWHADSPSPGPTVV